MTMPRRPGQRFGWRAAGLGPMPGFRGRRLAELQQRRLQFRLDQLAQQQARLTRLMEFLQERAAPEAPADRPRAARGGDRESPFSGRVPPHGGSGGGGQGGGRGSEGARSTESEETPEESEESEESEEADHSPAGGAVRAEEAGEEGDEDAALRAALFEVFDEL